MDSVYLQHTPEEVAKQGEQEDQLLRTESAQSRRLQEDGKQSLSSGERGFPVSWVVFSRGHASFPGKPKGN